MYKVDGRRIEHENRQEIRILAVKRVEAGESPAKVIKDLGFHRSCIYQWMAKYRKGGYSALKTKKISGRPTKIDVNQRKFIYNTIISKRPLQFEFESGLWNRKIIQTLIFDLFEIKISVNTVDRLLKKIGLDHKTPESFLLVKNFMKHCQKVFYPDLSMEARYKKALIYFFIETKTESNLNKISAVTTKDGSQFMIISGNLNASKFIDFLKCLIYNVHRPIYLILYESKICKTLGVRNFVKSTKGKLELFFI